MEKEIEFLQAWCRNGDGSWTTIKNIQIGGMSLAAGGVTVTSASVLGNRKFGQELDQLAAKYPDSIISCS